MCMSVCAYTCACTLSYFLVLQDAPCSSSIFPAPVLESEFLWRTLVSFIGKTKVWALSMLAANGIPCFWALSADRAWDICVYTIFILISLNISMCNHLCPYEAKLEYNWCLQPKPITWIFLSSGHYMTANCLPYRWPCILYKALLLSLPQTSKNKIYRNYKMRWEDWGSLSYL